jgi:NADH-quinone oxidoreductase subunit M
MTKRVFLGPVANANVAALKDLSAREFLMMSILAIFTIGMGVYPKPFTDVIHPSVMALLKHIAISKI